MNKKLKSLIVATLECNHIPANKKNINTVYHHYMITDNVEVDILDAMARAFGGDCYDYSFPCTLTN